MKYRWFKVEEKTPPVAQGYNILSDNVLVKMPGGEYEEAYYHHEKRIWYNADNNKKLKQEPAEWCEAS